jgi:hypothetical protein
MLNPGGQLLLQGRRQQRRRGRLQAVTLNLRMIRHVRAHGHSEQLHRTAHILVMPDRRHFHQRVRSGAASQAGRRARHPARSQRRHDALGDRSPGQILTGHHRLCHRGESAAQQMALPAAARAAVSLKRGRDRIRDLLGQIGGACLRLGRAIWRGIHGSVEEMAELVLHGLADRTRRRGAACTTRRAPDTPADLPEPALKCDPVPM